MGSKGDLFDGYLWAASLNANKDEPEQISDYPEHVTDILRAFYKHFSLPSGAIPMKKKKYYDAWIVQLEELSKLFSSSRTMNLAMERAVKIYKERYTFIIYQPSSIKKLLIEAIRELRSEQASAAQSPKLPEKVEKLSKEELKDIASLKNLLRKDD